MSNSHTKQFVVRVVLRRRVLAESNVAFHNECGLAHYISYLALLSFTEETLPRASYEHDAMLHASVII